MVFLAPCQIPEVVKTLLSYLLLSLIERLEDTPWYSPRKETPNKDDTKCTHRAISSNASHSDMNGSNFESMNIAIDPFSE